LYSENEGIDINDLLDKYTIPKCNNVHNSIPTVELKESFTST